MKAVNIPTALYQRLEKELEGNGVTVEDLLIDQLLQSFNDYGLYSEVSREYFELGRELEARGMLVEAGEAYWRSLAYLLKGIASKLGFRIESYQDYFSLIEFLSYKLGDGELVVHFVNSERLHGEFHPRSQSGDAFKVRKEHLEKLLVKLQALQGKL
ncbi:MAG: PaREP1 family protein [Candidatus Aramenus sp.]|jgi:hypothetical protein|nr:PaREP1 family protein [Candidatus Aramenus sp.]